MAAADKVTIARPTTTPHAALGRTEVNDEWATVVNHGDEQDASVNALLRDASLLAGATSCDYGRPGRREPPAPVVVLNGRKRKSTIADKRPAAPALVKDGSSAVLDALHQKRRRTEGTAARSPPSGATLSRAPLSGAPLSGAPLSGAPLSGAPLPGAPLSGAPPSSAPLTPVAGALSGALAPAVEHTGEDQVTWTWPPPGVLLWPSPPGGALLLWPASPPPPPSAAAGDQAADFDVSAGDRDAKDGRAAVAATWDGDAAAPYDWSAAKKKGSTNEQDPSSDSATTAGQAAAKGRASSGDCCPLRNLVTADRAADARPASTHKATAVLQGDRKGEVASNRAADALPLPASARVATSMPLGDRGAAADRGAAVTADRAADVLPASTDRAVAVAVDQAAVAIDVAAGEVASSHAADALPLPTSARVATSMPLGDRGAAADRGATVAADRAADVLPASTDRAVAVAVDQAAVAIDVAVGEVASNHAADALPLPTSARVATSMPLGDRGAAAARGATVADRAADVLPASTDRAVAVAVDQAAVAIDEAAVAAHGVTDAQLGDRAVAMDVDHAFNALLASAGATTAGLLGDRGAAGAADRATDVLQASADGAVAVAVDKAAVAAEDLAKAGAAIAAYNDALEMAAATATQATEAMVTGVHGGSRCGSSQGGAGGEHFPQWADQVGHRRGHGRERE